VATVWVALNASAGTGCPSNPFDFDRASSHSGGDALFDIYTKAMPSQPKVILWDIMDTLVTEPFFTAMPEFFGMTLDELIRLKHPTSWAEFEKGQISEEEYVQRFFQDGRPVDRDALRQCVRDAYRWLDGMQPLVAQLHERGHQMHAISNYPSWYRIIEQKLQLSRYLRWSFVSCHTGVRKPDLQAFSGPCEVLGVSPEQCLCIDDRPVNVEAARTMGMDAVLKQDAAQVRSELFRRGLL
jgi:HAD superfamily hydrolase (TIGR01509 family)